MKIDEDDFMENKKSNKGLIITLIIIIIIMFFTIIGLSFSLVIQKYRCNITSRTLDTIDKTADKAIDTFGKAFGVITKTEDGYTFPQIDFDSDDAEDINDEIEDFYDGLKGKDETKSTFKTYENGDIESVVVRVNNFGDNNIYRVYNINTKTGKKISSLDLMNKKKITLEEIKTKMKAVWLGKVKTSEGYSMRIASDYSTTVEQATNNNIDKLTADNIVLYLNKDGHLCVIYEEYQIAGAETGYYIIDLDNSLYTELK